MQKKNTLGLVASILTIIGGINWGLVGIGSFAGYNLNIVNRLLGSIPVLERLVYVVVGIAAVYMIYQMTAKK